MINLVYAKLSAIRRLIARFFLLPPAPCRFRPTCSEYCRQAVKKHKFKGVFLCLGRIGRCRPGQKGGWDPVL